GRAAVACCAFCPTKRHCKGPGKSDGGFSEKETNLHGHYAGAIIKPANPATAQCAIRGRCGPLLFRCTGKRLWRRWRIKDRFGKKPWRTKYRRQLRWYTRV